MARQTPRMKEIAPQVRELRAQGKSLNAIANELCVGWGTIRKVLGDEYETPPPRKVIGTPASKRVTPEIFRHRLWEIWNTGFTYWQTGNEHPPLAPGAVRYWDGVLVEPLEEK